MEPPIRTALFQEDVGPDQPKLTTTWIQFFRSLGTGAALEDPFIVDGGDSGE